MGSNLHCIEHLNTYGISFSLKKDTVDIISDLLLTAQKVVVGKADVSQDVVDNSLLLEINIDQSHPTVILKYVFPKETQAEKKQSLLIDLDDTKETNDVKCQSQTTSVILMNKPKMLTENKIPTTTVTEIPLEMKKFSSAYYQFHEDVQAREQNLIDKAKLPEKFSRVHIPENDDNEEELTRSLRELFSKVKPSNRKPIHSSVNIKRSDEFQNEVANFSLQSTFSSQILHENTLNNHGKINCQELEQEKKLQDSCANDSLSQNKKNRDKPATTLENEKRDELHCHSFHKMSETKFRCRNVKETCDKRIVAFCEKFNDQKYKESLLRLPSCSPACDSDLEIFKEIKTNEESNEVIKNCSLSEEPLLHYLAFEIAKSKVPFKSVQTTAENPPKDQSEVHITNTEIPNEKVFKYESCFDDSDQMEPSSKINFNKMNNYKENFPSANAKEDIQEGVYLCTYCDMAFPQLPMKNFHEKMHFKGVVKDLPPDGCKGDNNIENDPLIQLKNSLKQKTHALQLFVDSKTRNAKAKDKPYSCAICGKCFAQFSSKHDHEMSHNKQVLCTCKQHCKQLFPAVSSNDKPEKTHVAADKPYPCTYCGKKFPKTASRDQHEKTHTLPYACKYCGKMFSSATAKTQHEQCHMQNKPFFCSHCQKLFATKAAKDQHEATHPKV